MNAPKFWMVVPALLVAGAVSLAYAKLPVAPMDDAAKAAAETKKAKAAEQAKKDGENLAKSQDRAVANYKKAPGAKPASTTAVKKKK